MKTQLLLTALFVLFIMHSAWSQIPPIMSYQGILTDTQGNAVNGNRTLTFKFYEQAEGGSPIWEETQQVAVSNGLFNVILGSNRPLNLPFDKPYWLGITVGNESELVPRIALTSSPYSLNARSTVLEPQPGQGLTIRDATGKPTHVLSADGEVRHIGKGTFQNGLKVTGADTGMVVFSATGPAMVVIVGDTATGQSIDKLAHSAANTPRRNRDGDKGMIVRSKDTAVTGITSGDLTPAIFGKATSGSGVLGGSDKGDGVAGSSGSGSGGNFLSVTGPGIVANGLPAGRFIGDTHVLGEVFAKSLHVVRFKPDNTIGDTLTSFNADGTSFHSGKETFADSVKINKALVFPDGSVQTTAGGGEGPQLWLPSGKNTYSAVSGNVGIGTSNPQAKLHLLEDDTANVLLALFTSPGGIMAVTTDGKVGIGTTTPHYPLTVDGIVYSNTGYKFPDGSILTSANMASGWTDNGMKVKTDRAVEVNGIAAFNDQAIFADGFESGDVSSWSDVARVKRVKVDPNATASGSTVEINGNAKAEKIVGENTDPASTSSAIVGSKRTQQGGIVAGSLSSSFDLLLPTLEGTSRKAVSATQQEAPVITAFTDRNDGAGVFGQNANPSNTSPAVWGVNTGGGAGVIGQISNPSSNFPGVWAVTNGLASAFLVDHSGPSGNLATFRSGGTNQARIDKTGKGFFNGGTQTGGADIAEAFEVEDLVQNYEPGDVLAISTDNDRTVTKSREPYSQLVVGVYAAKPGVLLTERHIDENLENTIPVGVVGVIPTKVSGENGPIHRGDLLVASSTPGHAMKGTERDKMLGAIIGKALEEFAGNGAGMIRVLVNVK